MVKKVLRPGQEKKVPRFHRRSCDNTGIANKTDFKGSLNFIKMFLL